MYLITAYFDEKSNKRLQRYIDQIAMATGNDFMTRNHVPPHMTISSIEARNAEVLLQPFNSLKGQIVSEQIQFVSIGQILPYVFYATPVLDEYLQDISCKVYESVGNINETSVSRFYQPKSWLPHVTLGKTLEKEQMRMALQVMQDSFCPFHATVTELGLAKVNPHKDISRFFLR